MNITTIYFFEDSVGLSISKEQDLCHPVKTEDTYIHFEQNVEIQRYVEKLYKGNNIFHIFHIIENLKS